MTEQWKRTELLLGKENLEKLSEKRVAVFGIGGVGGYAVEALVRCGVGALDLIDHDTVSITNLNRQIIATHKTIGRYKVDVMKERILDINPDCRVTVHNCFYLPENKDAFDFTQYDYVIDAVDTVTAKLSLIEQAKECGTPVISSMGAGNKLDPAGFAAADIYETSVCPLAKVMRRELKKRGIRELKVVYSKEPPAACSCEEGPDGTNDSGVKRAVPGSVSFVPSAAGLVIAGEVIKDLIEQDKKMEVSYYGKI